MEESAEQLQSQAEKKLQGGFFSYFSSSRFEEATQLFVQAANQYKIRKQWEAAANCYIKAAKLQEKLDDINQRANYYIEAANLIKKYSTKDAEKWYTAAIEIYVKQGRFSQSAKLLKGIAEGYVAEGNYESAMKYFKRAADYFEMDEFGTAQFSQCILKYADLLSKLSAAYDGAIKIYETEGHKALQNALLQYGAKEHYLKAGILYLVKNDPVDCRIAFQRYENMDSRIATSAELKLLLQLLEAIETRDADQYVGIIEAYDKYHKLDDWKVHFLYKIKESLQGVTASAVVDAAGQYDFS